MKIGIATENWKVPEYEKALTLAGFKFKTTLGEKHQVAAIVVECEPRYADGLHSLCADMQRKLFHRKSKTN